MDKEVGVWVGWSIDESKTVLSKTLLTVAAAKRMSVDAAVEAVSLELTGIFTIKEELKKGTKGFCWRSAWFCFTPHWLWQEFS